MSVSDLGKIFSLLSDYQIVAMSKSRNEISLGLKGDQKSNLNSLKSSFSQSQVKGN